MRKIRVAVILFFVVSCICFGIYTVKVTMKADKNPPVISFEQEVLEVDLMSGEEVPYLQGVTASDKESGDLTEEVQVISVSKMSGGERTVKYVVFDEANLMATAERKVVYTNYRPPRILLSAPLRYTADQMMGEISFPITASDVFDGDITEQVRYIFDDELSANAGAYMLNLQVNNSAGDTCIVNAEITVVDAAQEAGKYYPELSSYIMYTPVGTELDVNSFLIGVASTSVRYIFGAAGTPANVSAARVSVSSSVDYETPGTYQVMYSYTTLSGVTATTTAFVVVEG